MFLFGCVSLGLKRHLQCEAHVFYFLARKRSAGLPLKKLKEAGGRLCGKSVKLVVEGVVRDGKVC